MRYATAAAFRVALDQRLKAEAAHTGLTITRLRKRARPTKDIDLGRDDSVDAAIEDIVSVQQLNLGDFFSFTATRTDVLEEIDELTAIRFSCARSSPVGRSSSSSSTSA